jgi:hypothetical protein
MLPFEVAGFNCEQRRTGGSLLELHFGTHNFQLFGNSYITDLRILSVHLIEISLLRGPQDGSAQAGASAGTSCGSSRMDGAWVCKIRLAFARRFCTPCGRDHKLPSRGRPSARNPSASHGRKGTASICLSCDSPHNSAAGPSGQTGQREYPRGNPHNPWARNGTIPRLLSRQA